MKDHSGGGFLAIFVAFTLVVPQSALALREIQTRDSGMEERELAEALRGGAEANRVPAVQQSAAGMEEFNPGHGRRLLERLTTERRKLLDALRDHNQTLILRFVNLLHTPPIQPGDIPHFADARFLSFELPRSAVSAFLASEPTVIRNNPFWSTLLEAAGVMHSAEDVAGVDAFAPARNAMRRVTYAYTSLDFDGGRPRKRVPLDGRVVDLGQAGLGMGVVSEEALVSRLTQEQREELERNRIAFLHAGDPSPFTEAGEPLAQGVILYRPPHESVRELMGKLRENYKGQLIEAGLPQAHLNNFLVEHFFFPIFILPRDHMQLVTIFRRWQVRLKGGAAPTGEEILALHLGGAMHFHNLQALASRDLPSDAPLKLEGQDDRRVPVLGGTFKGTPFFAQRFEGIMDHLRVRKDGEVELDVPYFVQLFGEYLVAQPETVRVEAIHHSLFPGASDTPEAVHPGEVSFEDYRSLTSLHGILSQLSGPDLQELWDLARSGEPVSSLERLQDLLGKEEYQTLPGMKELRLLVPRWHADAWCNLGIARQAQGDLAGAVAAYERAVTINPNDADASYNLGTARQAQGDLPGAVAAYERALAIKPDHADAWNNLGIARRALLRLKGQEDQSPAAGLEERMPGWLKGLVTPAELEQWIYRGHEALLGLRPVAVLFDPGLVPGKDDADREELLMEMEGYIRSLFVLPEWVRFRMGLLSARAEWEGEFRIIEIVRHPDAGAGAVPIGALPLVITEALASPRGLFYIDPLVYAGLKDLKLPDALAELTDLFA